MSLATDYAGIAGAGDRLEIRADIQKPGKSLSFANTYLACNGERIARSNGVYHNHAKHKTLTYRTVTHRTAQQDHFDVL
ncbi:MAG: hypothetical protein O7F71_03970 [Gammaproteobacteria bacterium]|nr:hypothetical protein [Gammaproteobacteria bacterium]